VTTVLFDERFGELDCRLACIRFACSVYDAAYTLNANLCVPHATTTICALRTLGLDRACHTFEWSCCVDHSGVLLDREVGDVGDVEVVDLSDVSTNKLVC
jgi:hypothetical protein